ncbi:hypothetical protein Bbelb_365460 [Branchiostoma belcheri]|nr:hypothetical protein Bbelb_365460 [Branchiostoma belcheri]
MACGVEADGYCATDGRQDRLAFCALKEDSCLYNPCVALATCTDNPAPPATCTCSAGYVGDGYVSGSGCSVGECNVLPAPTNGAVSGSNSLGDTVTYSCDSGYNLVGSATRTCQADLTWTASDPTCEAGQCPTPDAPTNGAVTGSNSLGDTVTYSCDSGYNLVGSATRTCQIDLTWTASAPTCEAGQCPTPDAPTNGAVTGSNSLGDTVTYSCDSGYNLVGSATRTCQTDLTWTASAPTCEAPTNGAVTGSNSLGDTVTYSCDSGYNLVGSATRTCQADLTWTASEPTCEAPTNGAVTGSNSFGDTVTYSCDSGYNLVGSATRTCQADLTWTASDPTCEAPTNGALTGSYSLGDTVTYSCDSGYNLVGSATRTCQTDLTWTASDPSCEAPTNGVVTGSNSLGDTVTYSCDSGYNLVGSATRTCQADLTWTASDPTCEAPTNGAVTGSNSLGDTVTYSCDSGYNLVGSATRTCQADLTWTASAPTCEAPTNGAVTGSYSLGDTVTYSCDSGYNLVGSATRTCQADLTWTTSAPTCEVPPPLTLNGESGERVTSFKLLGIVVSNDLKWGPHVEYMLAKVQPRIYYLRVARLLPSQQKCYCKSTSPLSDLCWSMGPRLGRSSALSVRRDGKDSEAVPQDLWNKGRCTVVLDREQYDRKVQDLLGDKDTYTPLKKDPTNKFKGKISSALKKLQTEGVLDRPTYLKLNPTTEQPPAFYGLPKIHKQSVPLRPIVSSIGSVTYELAGFLAKILGPLVGKSQHHVQNSADFVNKIKDIHVEDDETITLYDVCSLFTSIPPKEAVSVVREALEADDTLADRTNLSVDQVCELLELCLGCTYFTYKGQFYQQMHGCAMGSPVSPIVVNLYMEKFENKALSTFNDTPPANWFRYVDDTWCRLKKRVAADFFDHINQIDDNIKFTQEPSHGNMLPFLDTKTIVEEDGNLRFEVYRKPTHTDQYLAFDSHHPLEHKLAVIKTLFHRANNIITSDQAKTDEHRHLRGALAKCGYQNWTFNKALKPSDQSKKTQKCKPLTNKNKANITIPYVQGVSEKLRRIFQNFNIATNFKPHSTLRQRLVHPKDRPHKGTKANVIYRLKCEEPNCNNTYIGETSRPLKVRYKEHCRPSANGYSSAIFHHLQHNQGHSFKLESTDILDRETRWWERGVKEAIYERMYNPTLNREGGLRVDLSGTWDLALPAPRTDNT